MATRAIWSPLNAELPSASYAQHSVVNNRPVLAFDAAADESACFSGIAPQGFTGAVTAVVTYMMASAVADDVVVTAAIEAVSDGDATDLDAGDSFDTANSATATVPATAGYIDQISITCTNADSIAAGDYFRLKITRDADNVADSATGDLYLLAVELRDGA